MNGNGKETEFLTPARLYNCRLQYIPLPPDGKKFEFYEAKTFSTSLYNPHGVRFESYPRIETDKPRAVVDDHAGREKALRKIKNIVLNNVPFLLDFFVTLTFDKNVVDRYSYPEIMKKMNVWLDNRVRRKLLSYILVPELHKDGAIHFHGFFNSRGVQLVPSGKKRNGKTVYNISDFPLGFTTAIRVSGGESSKKTAAYIQKYITKSDKKIGGRWFLHGGFLMPAVYLYGNVPFLSAPGREFEVANDIRLRVEHDPEKIADMYRNFTFSILLKSEVDDDEQKRICQQAGF